MKVLKFWFQFYNKFCVYSTIQIVSATGIYLLSLLSTHKFAIIIGRKTLNASLQRAVIYICETPKCEKYPIRSYNIIAQFMLNFALTIHKKWSFPLKISSVNVTKSAGNCCSPVNLLHIFRTPFPKNTSGGLALGLHQYLTSLIFSYNRCFTNS